MNQTLYDMYCDIKSLLKKASECECPGAEQREMVSEWHDAIAALEQLDGDLKGRHERRVRIQESLTSEQIDFICYEIGDWYMEWKDRLVIDIKEGTHRLGYAKERLKSKICGE